MTTRKTVKTYPVKRRDGTTVRVTIPEREWSCPRCGLEGEHMRSPDPDRCKVCCKVDAHDALYRALRALIGPDGDLFSTANHEAARAALALAEGKVKP